MSIELVVAEVDVGVGRPDAEQEQHELRAATDTDGEPLRRHDRVAVTQFRAASRTRSAGPG